MRPLLAVFLFLSTFLAGEQKPEAVPELVFTNVSVVDTRTGQVGHNLRKMEVPFLAGSDGPDPYVFPGFSLHDEMELLVKAGFSPTQALQAATLNPALFLGKLDDYGVVEKGRVADLVLLDGDPIEDIRNTRKIDSVVLRGKLYSREDLDKILAQVEELAAKE